MKETNYSEKYFISILFKKYEFSELLMVFGVRFKHLAVQRYLWISLKFI